MSVLRRYYVGAFVGSFIGALAGMATTVGANEVPSGQPVTLYEVLVDNVDEQSWLRFRFTAPQIARENGTINYEQAAADMEHLCQTIALPYLTEYDLKGDMIVISLADRETVFGQSNPEATQFFDAFRVENGACIWEAF